MLESSLVNEGDIVTIAVTVSQAVSWPVRVRVRTLPGSAREPMDYLTVDRAIVFEPGETVQSVNVYTADNVTAEQPERFHVLLSEAVGVRQSRPGVVTIIDNDALTSGEN